VHDGPGFRYPVEASAGDATVEGDFAHVPLVRQDSGS
jgi:hypothetical protein